MEVAESKEQGFFEVSSFLGMLPGKSVSPRTMISKYRYRRMGILNERRNVNIDALPLKWKSKQPGPKARAQFAY